MADQLSECAAGLERLRNAVIDQAAREGIDPYRMQSVDGQMVLAPILAAWGQVLAARVSLGDA